MTESIVVVCMGGIGHVQILLPVISGLASRGRVVHVMTRSDFRTQVEGAGARFVDLYAHRPLDAVDATSIPFPSRLSIDTDVMTPLLMSNVLDRLGLDLRPGTTMARSVFMAPREPGSPTAPPSYEVGQRLVFGRNGNGLPALCSGWSYAESVGVWSEGIIARLEFVLRELSEGPLQLEIELAAAMVGESHPTLDVHVLVDSSRVARWRLAAPFAAPAIQEVAIPAGLLVAMHPCTIDFRIMRPRSPASLGLSGDQRLLGIHLSSLRLRPGPVA